MFILVCNDYDIFEAICVILYILYNQYLPIVDEMIRFQSNVQQISSKKEVTLHLTAFLSLLLSNYKV